jgi:5-formyltetrahydrofolate cyclo-ligase
VDSPKAKREIRARIIARREALSESLRREWSAAITSRLLALEGYRGARLVAAYASFRAEFDTSAFLAAALAAGKRLALPRVAANRERLEYCFVADPARDLAPGTWGIPEPGAHCEQMADGAAVDFVLAPGLAFTRRGDRLGYGRGYFDRFIASLPGRPLVVAGAYSMQVVGELPVEPHDRRVQVLVTEWETIDTTREPGTKP